ncbi:MAG: hypothetical protein ACLTER_11340 [Ruminococcus sp.]
MESTRRHLKRVYRISASGATAVIYGVAPMADYKAAASYTRFAGKCGVSCHQGTPKESLPFVLF